MRDHCLDVETSEFYVIFTLDVFCIDFMHAFHFYASSVVYSQAVHDGRLYIVLSEGQFMVVDLKYPLEAIEVIDLPPCVRDLSNVFVELGGELLVVSCLCSKDPLPLRLVAHRIEVSEGGETRWVKGGGDHWSVFVSSEGID